MAEIREKRVSHELAEFHLKIRAMRLAARQIDDRMVAGADLLGFDDYPPDLLSEVADLLDAIVEGAGRARVLIGIKPSASD